jgi:hypothetical protein
MPNASMVFSRADAAGALRGGVRAFKNEPARTDAAVVAVYSSIRRKGHYARRRMKEKRFRSCTPRRWGWGTPLKNVQAPESVTDIESIAC